MPGNDLIFVWVPAVALVATGVIGILGAARAGGGVFNPAGASSPPVLRGTWIERPILVGARVGPVSWLLLAFTLMLTVNLVLVFIEQDRKPIWSMMAKTLDVGLIPLTLVYSRRLLDEWLASLHNFVEIEPTQVQQRFARELRRLFRSHQNALLGMLVGVFILLFEYRDYAFDQRSFAARVVVVLASFVMTSLAGFALVVMVRGALLISDVGRLEIRVSASPYGILSTGRMLVKAFAGATAVYLVAVSTMVLRTGFEPNWLILAWVFVVAGMFVAMFLAPQLTIHRRMVQFKRERLLRIERALQAKLDAFDREPDKPTHELIEALRKRRDEIEGLPSWPFNWKNFTGVLGLAVSSTLPVLLKTLLSGVGAWVMPLLPAALPR